VSRRTADDADRRTVSPPGTHRTTVFARMNPSPSTGPTQRPIKQMRPGDVARLLERDPRLVIPVGTCEQHGPHLPLGSDTIIVERLSSDLSAEFEVLLAPTVEYGVNVVTEKGFAGNGS